MSKADAKRVVSSLREDHGKKALSKLPKVASDVAKIRAKGPSKKELEARNAALEAQVQTLQAQVTALSDLSSKSVRTYGTPDPEGMARAQGAYDLVMRRKMQEAADRYYDAHGESLSDTMFRSGY